MLDDNIVLCQRRQAVLGVQLALGIVGRPVAPADWAVHLGAGHGADFALVALGQGAVKEMRNDFSRYENRVVHVEF